MHQWARRTQAKVREMIPSFVSKRSAAAKFWGHQHSQEKQEHAFWLADREVMEWVNLKVSGKRAVWPLSWFLLSLPKDVIPVRRAVSIGCGPGNLEREVMRHAAASYITGVDMSSTSLELLNLA